MPKSTNKPGHITAVDPIWGNPASNTDIQRNTENGDFLREYGVKPGLIFTITSLQKYKQAIYYNTRRSALVLYRSIANSTGGILNILTNGNFIKHGASFNKIFMHITQSSC